MGKFTRFNEDLVSPPFLASLDEKGRTTIPVYLRKKLDLKPREKILIQIFKPKRIERFKIIKFSQVKEILNKLNSAQEILFFQDELLLINPEWR